VSLPFPWEQSALFFFGLSEQTEIRQVCIFEVAHGETSPLYRRAGCRRALEPGMSEWAAKPRFLRGEVSEPNPLEKQRCLPRVGFLSSLSFDDPKERETWGNGGW